MAMWDFWVAESMGTYRRSCDRKSSSAPARYRLCNAQPRPGQFSRNASPLPPAHRLPPDRPVAVPSEQVARSSRILRACEAWLQLLS